MTLLAERLDEAVGLIEPAFDLADVKRRVRHRRQLRRATGAAVIAVIVVVAAIARAGGGGTPSRVRVRPAAPTAISDVLVFDDTGGVLTVNLATHVATHHPLDGWRPGDQPFLSERVGDTFVVGWGDVYAAPFTGGASRHLGAGVFVPATEPGAVWLTSYGKVQTPTERLVDLRGRVLLQDAAPAPAEVAVTGVPGGLAFESPTGIDIWDARSGRITRHLGNARASAAPAFGSLLAWCDRCDRTLELTDLRTGSTRHIALSLSGRTLSLSQFAFSPDGGHLALPAWPDAASAGGTAQIVVVDAVTGTVVDQIDTRTRYASLAWSPDSNRIDIAAASADGTEVRILVHDVADRTTRDLGLAPRDVGQLSAVLSRDDAARLPMPAAGGRDACLPPQRPNSGKPLPLCSFRF